jgi:hypothetical protein
MKKIIFLLFLVTAVSYGEAQRFFYIESNPITDCAIRAELLGAAQFITPTPLSSDYIIRTDVVFKEMSHLFTMKIILVDSVSLKPIYQTTEEQTFAEMNSASGRFLKLTLQTFIDNNLSRVIFCAKEDHEHSQMNWLKPRKDKT